MPWIPMSKCTQPYKSTKCMMYSTSTTREVDRVLHPSVFTKDSDS